MYYRRTPTYVAPTYVDLDLRKKLIMKHGSELCKNRLMHRVAERSTYVSRGLSVSGKHTCMLMWVLVFVQTSNHWTDDRALDTGRSVTSTLPSPPLLQGIREQPNNWLSKQQMNQQTKLIFVGIQICSVLPNKDSVMPAISRHTSVDTYLKAEY